MPFVFIISAYIGAKSENISEYLHIMVNTII